MLRRIATVKGQVTLMLVLFSAVVLALITVSGLYLVRSYQRQIDIKGIEFNLQLVANLIEQDLRELARIGWASSNDMAIAEFLLTEGDNERSLSIIAHDQMIQSVAINSTRQYVRRLLIVDGYNSKILQVDNFASSSLPVNIHNIDQITGLEMGEWFAIMSDPYNSSPDFQVLPLVHPVYHPSNRNRIGTIYLLVNGALITDKLIGYHPADDSYLYLEFSDKAWMIEGDVITQIDFDYRITGNETGVAISPLTTVSTARDDKNAALTIVTYPIRDGVFLTQVSPQRIFTVQLGVWIWMLAGLVFTIILMGIIVIYSLGKTISKPVALLRQKIDAIAGGDFTQNPDLESRSELGIIGQGVNRLSQDILVLMENRIKDEHQKRDLEYRMLQSQITPHFLYNTINSIKWMATLQGADGIVEMVTSLSRLLKTISKDIRKVVSLEDELALLDDYLVIQKYRYGNSIVVTNEIEQVFTQTKIPRFSLQPLVENAIFHGIRPKGQGHIVLSAVFDVDDVLVTVTDDGVGMSKEVISKFKDKAPDSDTILNLGLRNVDSRLRYAFGDTYGLSISSKEGDFTSVTLRMPGI
jgi:two-component system sensor histidine kinase YesM